MNTRNLISAGLVLALSACANTYTYSKGGSAQELHADLEVCKPVMARLTGDAAKAAMDQCMAEKGYEKVVDQYRF